MRTPQFVFSNNMSIKARMTLIAILAIVGIFIQLFYSLFIGWFFLLAAVLHAIVKSESTDPEAETRGDWQSVTTGELEMAETLLYKSSSIKEKSGVLSATNGAGCAVGLLMLIGIGAVGLLIWAIVDNGISSLKCLDPVFGGGWLSALFVVDAVTLMAPIWLSGSINIWQPPYLQMRLSQILYIYKKYKSNSKLEFQPSFMLARGKQGRVPLDCKLMVKIKDADPNFMGIQVQTSLNNIQGAKLPYTYCVILAKPAFDLIGKASSFIKMPPEGGFPTGIFSDENAKKEAQFAEFGEMLVELKREGEMELAVVRQNTKGTGYRTSAEQAEKVFVAAYQLAKDMLGS